MTTSDRFLLLMREEGLNQTTFSEKTGFTRTTLSNFINGNVKTPKIDLLEAVAKHYPHWNLRWILLGTGEMFFTPGMEIIATPNSLQSEPSKDLEIEKLKLDIDRLENTVKDKEEIIGLLREKFGK